MKLSRGLPQESAAARLGDKTADVQISTTLFVVSGDDLDASIAANAWLLLDTSCVRSGSSSRGHICLV